MSKNSGILTYGLIKTLRENPTKSFVEFNYEDKLLKILLFEPELFNDYFLVEKKFDITEQERNWVECYCSQIDALLGLRGEVSASNISDIKLDCLIRLESPELEETPQTQEYEKYCLTKSDKIMISEETLAKIKKRAFTLRYDLQPGKIEKCDEDYNIKRIISKALYVGAKHVYVPNTILSATVGKAAIEAEVDLIAETKKVITITNIVYSPSILEFPTIYKERGFDILASLQRYILISYYCVTKTVDIYFLVTDDKESYTFRIGKFLDIKDQVSKAFETLSCNTRLPYEFTHQQYEL